MPRRVPAPNDERFSATREWALARLHEPLTIAMLSGHALVSQRTFSRAFLEETGYTPMHWAPRFMRSVPARGVILLGIGFLATIASAAFTPE